MRPTSNLTVVILSATAISLFTGCATHHTMRGANDGSTVSICRDCYDEAVRVWESGHYAGGRWIYAPTQHVRVEHHCASCKSTMVVQTADGRWTLTCPGCAPEGVPCDKCMPSGVESTAVDRK